MEELEWWHAHIREWKSTLVTAGTATPTMILTTDASTTGWGATLEGQATTHGFFPPEIQARSSNYRELYAVYLALSAFKEKVNNQHILLRTDNITTMYYINGQGGPHKHLNKLTKLIFWAVKECHTSLRSLHLPGDLNTRVDELSRLNPVTEWSLHQETFQQLENLWGPHSGPLRHQQQLPAPEIQQQILRPSRGGHGRHASELEGREQLHLPLENAEPDRQQDQTGELRRDPHRPIVALSSVVSHTAALKLRFVLHQQPEHPPSTLLGKRRAAEKQQVETSSLQDIWQEHANDWDIETRALLADSLRPSTLHSYDGVLKRFDRFCTDNYFYFPTTTAAVAHFLRDISSKSTRPGPSLITASAAIAGMYKGSLLNDPNKSQLLSILKQAIVNTGTKQPRKNTDLPHQQAHPLHLRARRG